MATASRSTSVTCSAGVDSAQSLGLKASSFSSPALLGGGSPHSATPDVFKAEVYQTLPAEAFGAVASAGRDLLHGSSCGFAPALDFSNPAVFEHAPLEVLLRQLGTSMSDGLTEELAARRLRLEGPNEIRRPRQRFHEFCAANWLSLANLLFALAALAYFMAGRAGLGVTTLFAVIAKAAVDGAFHQSVDRKLQALGGACQAEVLVVRGGRERRVPSSSLVRGDVLHLAAGDVAAADLRLLESWELHVDESAMPMSPRSEASAGNGKGSGNVPKAADSPRVSTSSSSSSTGGALVFSGSSIRSGSARAVVVATGMGTRKGALAGLLKGTREGEGEGEGEGDSVGLPWSAWTTPLQGSLRRLGIFTELLALFVFVLGLLTSLILGRENSWTYMNLTSLTLAVAAIPQGTQIALAVALCDGWSRLFVGGLPVRHLRTVESLGCTAVICSPDSGVLTEGRIQPAAISVAGRRFQLKIAEAGQAAAEPFPPAAVSPFPPLPVLRSALLVAALSSQGQSPRPRPRQSLSLSLSCGESEGSPRQQAAERQEAQALPSRETWSKLLGFSPAPDLLESSYCPRRRALASACLVSTVTSARPQSATPAGNGDGASACPCPVTELGLLLPPSTEAQSLLCVQGAARSILEVCGSRLAPDGSTLAMDEAAKSEAQEHLEALESEGSTLQVLAVACRPLAGLPTSSLTPTSLETLEEQDTRSGARESESLSQEQMDLLLQDLTLVALVSLSDPPREGVCEALREAAEASLRVVLFSQHSPLVADACARGVGIPSNAGAGAGSATLECTRLRPKGPYLAARKIDRLTRGVQVFAGTKPMDALEILLSLQRQGLTSAVISTSDAQAQALSFADIGIGIGVDADRDTRGRGRERGSEVARREAAVISKNADFLGSIVKGVQESFAICSGTRSYVAFLLCTRLAAVLQIAVCIAGGLPVPRTPAQIQYLLLVTNALPSLVTSFEFEPGLGHLSLGIERSPAPRLSLSSPVVLPARAWLYTLLNSLLLAAGTGAAYLWALAFYLHIDIDTDSSQEDHESQDLEKARTVAFITSVYSESIWTYTCRSPAQLAWRQPRLRPCTHQAVGLAQVGLYLAVLAPGLSQLLGLRGLDIGWQGWLVALASACSSAFASELCKLLFLPICRGGRGRGRPCGPVAAASSKQQAATLTCPWVSQSPSGPASDRQPPPSAVTVPPSDV